LATFEKGTAKGFALFFKREVEPKPTLMAFQMRKGVNNS
jgi:hypothetical protein